MGQVDIEPTDEHLFDLAENLLAGIDRHIVAEPGFIKAAVLEQRELWTLLYAAHHDDIDAP